MTLLYEHCDKDIYELQSQKKLPNLQHAKVKPKNVYGHHHTSVITQIFLFFI